VSTLEEQELIEQEIVEQMAPDTDAEPDGEPEQDEPEAVQEAPQEPLVGGLTPEEIEKRFKAAQRSWDTYERAIDRELDFTREILKDCPMCFTGPRGFVNLNDAGKQPDPLKNLILEFIGISTEKTYKQDDQIQTCPRCDGEGKLATGSKVASAKTILCPTCKGYGCSPPPEGDVMATPTTVQPLAPVTEISVPLVTADVDEFQEPRILPDGRPNPNFGKFPQHKVPVAPWGVTAGLTAQHAA